MNDKVRRRIEFAKENGLTYERLFEIAYKMHLEIFHLTTNEKEVYDKIGLTDTENSIFGYGYINETITDPDIAMKLQEIVKRNIEQQQQQQNK